jgi:hypothetical protein
MGVAPNILLPRLNRRNTPNKPQRLPLWAEADAQPEFVDFWLHLT